MSKFEMKHKKLESSLLLPKRQKVSRAGESPRGRLQTLADNGPQVNQLQSYQKVADQTRPVQKHSNSSKLPPQLKSGIESLAGISMDDVKVNYNSKKPSQLQAHAFAQGNQIHVAPGQDKHLPHEAWHVVQQKQGRVKPTVQMSGVSINDDKGLEKEADVMGAKALQQKPDLRTRP